MILREQLLKAINHEADVCIHLAGKIPVDGFDYRPSEKQRSTIELMRYLASVAIASLEAMLAGEWSGYAKREEAVAAMTPEEFADAMRAQMVEFDGMVAAVSDEEMLTRIVRAPGLGEAPLGEALMRTVYAWLVAYRHELFLRTKAVGNHEIGTANNWAGVDRKKPAVAE